MKAMFFYLLDNELQCVRWNKNSILWFSFRLHLKSHPHSQIELPVAITNIIYLSVPELENSMFLDLVLLCDTPVASYPFYCPSWRSTPNSSSATLSHTCFWIFLPSGIQSGKETDVGRQHLNLSSLSLFSFSELNKALDTWWRVLISLHKTARNSVRPILVSQYSIGNPSLPHVQFRKNHIKWARLLWGLKNKFSVPIWYSENQIWHTDNSYLSQKEKAIFFLCWSSFRSEFSNHRQNTGFGDKSIVFLRFRENLGLG